MLNNITMKTRLFLFIAAIILGFSTTGTAQNIDINNIALLKPGVKTQGLFIGDDISKATTVLGAPASISDKFFEMADANAKVYSYGANKLYFINNKLYSYNLADNTIEVGTVNGTTFKLGDKILTKTITRTVPRGQHGSVTETITTRTFLNFTLISQGGTINGLKYQTQTHSQILRNNVYTDTVFGLLFNSNDELVSVATVEQ